MNFTKEEKEYFATKARDLIAWLHQEGIPSTQQNQILRRAMLDVEVAVMLGSDLSSSYICCDDKSCTKALRVCDRFPTIGELLAARRDEILQVAGVGPKTLQQIYQCLIDAKLTPRWQP